LLGPELLVGVYYQYHEPPLDEAYELPLEFWSLPATVFPAVNDVTIGTTITSVLSYDIHTWQLPTLLRLAGLGITLSFWRTRLTLVGLTPS
jgi:hypothetical protein